LKINQEECAGCGICARICPDGIEMKDGVAYIINDNSTCIKEAAESCPYQIIEL